MIRLVSMRIKPWYEAWKYHLILIKRYRMIILYSSVPYILPCPNGIVNVMQIHSEILDIIKNKKLEEEFEPSMKTLLRLLKVMVENGPKAKTSLSVDTNLNYARLAKHIVWLEKKGLVESTIDKSKINVGLTSKGRIFASVISS